MTKTGKRIALVPAVLAGVVVLFFLTLWACTPRLGPYQHTRFPHDTAKAASQGLRVTFLGVSTLLIQDDSTAFMTDGFFTRTKIPWVLWRLDPNEGEIDRVLSRLGVNSLEAVIALHSHYDHAMDSHIVAKSMHATLVGSRSTAVIASASQSSARFDTVYFGDRRVYGAFNIRFIECSHGPPDRFPGEIESLRLPAFKGGYRTGDCHTLLIQHGERSMLVTGTAGFEHGTLDDVRADVVYLSVGGLGAQDSSYRARYWNEVVQTTGARRVVLIHWDSFFRSLFKPLKPVPWTPLKRYRDWLPTTIDHLCTLAKRDSVDLRLALEWVAVDPFEDLHPDSTIVPSCRRR